MVWKLPQLLFRPITKRHVEEQILYNTSIQQLFNIIQDVNQYSSFLPLCTYSKVIPSSQRQLLDGRQYFEATMTVGIPPFVQETYDSAVYVHANQYIIETQSIKSQKFDSLKSYWKLSSSSSSLLVDQNIKHQQSTTTNMVENTNPNIRSSNDNSNFLQQQQQQQIIETSSSSSPMTTTTATTNVYFMVEMTVSDPMIVTTLDQLLEHVAKQQVAAFAQRCVSTSSIE